MMSNCSCVYVGGDTDYGREFYQERIQKAKKEHICCECGETILPGQNYKKCVGSWEGEFFTYKICFVCSEIIDAFFCDGFFFEQTYDDLHSHILEIDGNIESECLANLSPKAREVICNMIEEYWEESDEDV